MISFFGEINNKKLLNFSLFNTEETNIVLLFLSITRKKAPIHDTGFIAQIAGLIYDIPFQTYLAKPFLFPFFLNILLVSWICDFLHVIYRNE